MDGLEKKINILFTATDNATGVITNIGKSLTSITGAIGQSMKSFQAFNKFDLGAAWGQGMDKFKESAKVVAPALDKVKASFQSLSGVMGKGKTLWSELGIEDVSPMKKATVQLQRFNMNLLGTMFFGMQLQRTFGRLWKSMLDTFKKVAGKTNPLNMALTRLEASFTFLKFSIMEAMSPLLERLVIWLAEMAVTISNLSPGQLTAIGLAIGGLFTAGFALFTASQVALFANAVSNLAVLWGLKAAPGTAAGLGKVIGASGAGALGGGGTGLSGVASLVSGIMGAVGAGLIIKTIWDIFGQKEEPLTKKGFLNAVFGAGLGGLLFAGFAGLAAGAIGGGLLYLAVKLDEDQKQKTQNELTALMSMGATPGMASVQAGAPESALMDGSTMPTQDAINMQKNMLKTMEDFDFVIKDVQTAAEGSFFDKRYLGDLTREQSLYGAGIDATGLSFTTSLLPSLGEGVTVSKDFNAFNKEGVGLMSLYADATNKAAAAQERLNNAKGGYARGNAIGSQYDAAGRDVARNEMLASLFGAQVQTQTSYGG